MIGLGRLDALRLFLASLHIHIHHHEKKPVATSTGQHTRMSCQASSCIPQQQAGPALSLAYYEIVGSELMRA